MSGRRVHERYDYQLDVVVVHEGRNIHGATRNISLGGMFIIVTEPIAYGEKVNVRFRLPAMKEDSEIPGTVRWSTAEGLGIQFGSLRAMEVWALNQMFKSV